MKSDRYNIYDFALFVICYFNVDTYIVSCSYFFYLSEKIFMRIFDVCRQLFIQFFLMCNFFPNKIFLA